MVRRKKLTRVKVGTRGSRLALAQSEMVVDQLRALHPDVEFKIIPIRTKGDRIKTVKELRFAGKGLFVKEIEQALLSRRIDLAIHSLKDMPSELPEKLAIAAVPERGEAADAFVGRDGATIESLPEKSVVATSSLRRQAQLLSHYPHLRLIELKGNLDTRLAVLENRRKKIAGIVVAAAGLQRLYPNNNIPTQLLPKDKFIPAPGQGALCIETRADNDQIRELVRPLDHPLTRKATRAERLLMERLEGGCQIPLGAHAEMVDEGFFEVLRLRAGIGLPDGSKWIDGEAKGSLEDPKGMARALETMLRSRGATEILDQLGGTARVRRVKARPKKKSRPRPKRRAKAKRKARRR